MKDLIAPPKRPIKPVVDFTRTSDSERKPMTEDGEATVDGVVMGTWKCANEALSQRIADLFLDFYTGKL
jgi:hypothetical protein